MTSTIFPRLGFMGQIRRLLHYLAGGTAGGECHWPWCRACESWRVQFHDAVTTVRGPCGHLWDGTKEERCERCALLRELASYRWPKRST